MRPDLTERGHFGPADCPGDITLSYALWLPAEPYFFDMALLQSLSFDLKPSLLIKSCAGSFPECESMYEQTDQEMIENR
jgi:hypothetical protein